MGTIHGKRLKRLQGRFIAHSADNPMPRGKRFPRQRIAKAAADTRDK
ncbi:hypothetical protein C4K23_3621 [Pseudomonas chlororaphis]|nr:hypothetical protein C4K23_3621 [Pseudomonas chlororaphis]ETD40725.1 hypothetical protein U724_06125 [Pseudomonas chlororaphis subsp. aurantiaca PB-St2]